MRNPGRPGNIRLIAALAERGGVALVRTPGGAGAGALLQSIEGVIFAIAQPVGLDPELSPWPLIAGRLAQLDGPPLTPLERSLLARLGRRSAEAISTPYRAGEPLGEQTTAELLLTLLARQNAVIAAHWLDRAHPGAVRIAELLAVEIASRGTLLLGARDGPVAEQLEAAVRSAGGLVIRLTPADVDDALVLIESGLASLDLTSAFELIERLLEQFDESPDPGREAEVCARLARMLRDVGASREEWERLVRRGLRSAGLAGSERSSVLLGLLVERSLPIPGAIPAAIRIRPPSSLLAISRRRGEPVLVAESIDPFGSLDLTETRSLVAEAQAWSEPSARLHGLEIAARMLLYRHGELGEAASLFRQIEDESTHHGLPWLRATGIAQQATCLLAAGSIDDAIAMLEIARETIAQLGRGGRLRGIADVAFASSIAMVRGGDLQALRARASEAIRLPGGWSSPLPSVAGAYDAWLALTIGERDAARDRVTALVSIMTAQGPSGYAMNGIAGIAARVDAALGGTMGSGRITETIEGLIEMRVGPYPVTSPEIARADLRSADEPTRAIDELVTAARSARERGFATAALLAESRAELLRVRLEPRETARLIDFIPAAERFGLDTREHRRLAGPDIPPRAPAMPGGVSEREQEVLALVAGGATTAEIAAQLFLSPHTVTRHLANAYAKIGARNRAEATSWVIRTGLIESAGHQPTPHCGA